MSKQNIVKYVCAFVCVLTVFVGTNVFAAANNNIGFSFTIKTNKGNSNSAARLRSKTNAKDTWKVDLRSSGEGKKTITNFWLEATNGNNVSGVFGTAQGSGANYQ